MPIEQLVIYVLVAGFTLLQVVASALKRRRQSELEPQLRDPTAPETGEQWWDPVPETAPPEVRIETKPSPVVPRPRAPERSAARPGQQQPAAQTRRQVRAEHASHHRIALRNRAELRRAVQLMAILGPPRSRVPHEP